MSPLSYWKGAENVYMGPEGALDTIVLRNSHTRNMNKLWKQRVTPKNGFIIERKLVVRSGCEYKEEEEADAEEEEEEKE